MLQESLVNMASLRGKFDKDLSTLDTMVTEMLNHVINHFNVVQENFENKKEDVLNTLIKKDEIINDYEDDINEKAFLIITQECPVARDLRTILSSIRIANELERLGDYASNLAKNLIKTENSHPFNKYVIEYFKPLNEMLKQVKIAFAKRSIDAAYLVVKLDDDIDTIYEKQVNQFITILKREVNVQAEESGRLLIVIKQLERAGDHLTNIAEAIIFLIRALRITLN